MSWAKLGLQRNDERGRGAWQIGRPCPNASGTRPVFRPADESTA